MFFELKLFNFQTIFQSKKSFIKEFYRAENPQKKTKNTFGLTNQKKIQYFGLTNQIFINSSVIYFLMDEELIKEVLLEQNSYTQEKIIERELLIKLKEFSKTPFVIIVSGIRRCGKSTLLKNNRDKSNSYYVNFDDDRFFHFQITDFQKMLELLQELYGEKNIFYFDEIQNIVGWERFVRRLRDTNKKVYISGSNAEMLSRELGTHLTGRYIQLDLFPFSFKEFLKFKNEKFDLNKLTSAKKIKLKRLFNEYLKLGGFPEYLKNKKQEYLRDLYQSILYKDIITRYKITEKALKEVTFFVTSNIGKEISFNQLKKLTGFSSATTIKEYFEYLKNSYLVFLINRYDSSLKKQIYSNKKAYFIDVALANIIGFRTSKDKGRLIENIVFLQLKRKNKEIYFHKNKKECDFLIKKGIKIIQAIQVTQTLQNEETKKREIEGLLEALKKYKLKEGMLLIENNDEKKLKIEGKKIIIKPVWKWLLE